MGVEQDIKLDFQRSERVGLDEAVFCASKSDEHLAAILDAVAARQGSMLLTRLSTAQLNAMHQRHREALDYDPLSRTGVFGAMPPLKTEHVQIAVVSAGTSDTFVAREAERTLRYNGLPSTRIGDVGVAGLWRLQERLDEIRRHPILILCAGMDAALPTVVGGLVSSVIIGVPTSVGYGVAEGGHTALHSMLASCSQGLTVMNIDNGFGAACAAIRVLHASSRITR